MSISQTANAYIQNFRTAIEGSSVEYITQQIKSEDHSIFRDETLSLVHDGSFRAFYAPFDWVNLQADVVIVGVTPGKKQALEALLILRSELRRGRPPEQAACTAKQAASFKGGMRSLGARLMDHFEFHKIFDLKSTIELFGEASHRAHYTSVLRYPALKDLKNYSGDKRITERRFMRQMIVDNLAPELASLPDAWIVPFGPTAHHVLQWLAARGIISSDRILGGILHPSGTQWNRYNVQLDLITRDQALKVPGGREVLQRSEALKAKVARILKHKAAA